MRSGIYPGDDASANQILSLASEYDSAAQILMSTNTKNVRCPFRMTALHAIELYLNAHLVHTGFTLANVRGLQHDLAARAAILSNDLKLRAKTKAHLTFITRNREYLVTRYQPLARELSELNRISATLTEIREKVVKAIRPAGDFLPNTFERSSRR
ncbi:MAG: hypothetical protein IPG54_15055 [Sphingomonadales bacterium]|nr:hypothetical protein [Sphingomonadales bacterium]